MASLRILLAVGWLIASGGHALAASSETGSIAGQVKLVGDVPTLPPQPVYTHTDTCGSTVTDERLVVDDQRDLANVVVYVQDAPPGIVASEPPPAMDNLRCRFIPHVVATTVGQTLSIHNSDPFLHDAHAWLGTKTLFNRALIKGATIREQLDEPGLVHINCNVRHTWMQAYVFVGRDPLHAVTGSDGRFRIDGIPPGTYTVTMWHELVGSQDHKVTVTAGQTTMLDGELAVTAPPPAAAS
ncbi:MAG TPA: carboxypeptidase regulatory-like domain-containing protein [Candidatus Binatia bacterium]|nr:carboxypeptidase regulatory-like domain-containing protein [Candidatus Binatia bacterium]